MPLFIDESQTAKNSTPNASVAGVFGTSRRIESITIHHWGAFGQTHDGVLDWFCNPRSSCQTSAHFVVSAGRINCIVSPWDASWAAGNAYGNATSIHIECHPEATDEDYAAVAWLVAWLRGNYGADLPLRPHNYWTLTACPGQWDLDRVDALARGNLTFASPSAASPIPATPKETAPVADVYTPLDRYDPYGKKDGKQTSVALEAQWASANFATVRAQIAAVQSDVKAARSEIAGVASLLKEIAGAQGVALDYAALGRAVVDEQARRLTS